jgi:hypothetical protein
MGAAARAATALIKSVETARYHVRKNQKWIITPASGGFYKIMNAAGGIVLAATDKTVIIAPFTGDDSQLWKLDQLADGSYCIASKAGKLALAATVKMKPGGDVTLEKFSGNDSQHWLNAAPWMIGA